MEVVVAVAGIIRQQACGLGVWCPEEEGGGGGGGGRRGGSRKDLYPCRLVLPHLCSLATAASRPRQRLLSIRHSEA